MVKVLKFMLHFFLTKFLKCQDGKFHVMCILPQFKTI